MFYRPQHICFIDDCLQATTHLAMINWLCISGYDTFGYDKDGYDRLGYNAEGFDREGFNIQGYNRDGEFDGIVEYSKDGYNVEGFNRWVYVCVLWWRALGDMGVYIYIIVV